MNGMHKTRVDIVVSKVISNCRENMHMSKRDTAPVPILSRIFQIWRYGKILLLLYLFCRESFKYCLLKMSDSSYVAVHSQAWQSYVTVHSLLSYGPPMQLSPGVVHETKSRRSSLTPQLYVHSQQSELSIPIWICLFLDGELSNDVGIYESKSAEGFSAFQRRSCINCDDVNVLMSSTVLVVPRLVFQCIVGLPLLEARQLRSTNTVSANLSVLSTWITLDTMALYCRTHWYIVICVFFFSRDYSKWNLCIPETRSQLISLTWKHPDLWYANNQSK